MPLKISNPAKEAAVLNRWADSIELQLRELNTHVLNKAGSTNTVAVAVPPPVVAVPTTDGLVHGDPVWEFDSAFSLWRDDFNYATYAGAANGAGIGQGETGWSLFGTGTNSASYLGGVPPNLGVYEFTLNAPTANYMTGIYPDKASYNGGGGFTLARTPYFDYPGWKMTWIFSIRLPQGNFNFAFNSGAFSLHNLSVYVGLGNGRDGNPNSTTFAPRPQQFVGVRYDTDTTSPSINDTTFHLEACFNTLANGAPLTRFNNVGTGNVGGNFDTGIVPQHGVFYRLDMEYLTVGNLKMTLSGGGKTASTNVTLAPIFQHITPASGNANQGAPWGLGPLDGTLTFLGGPFSTNNTDGWAGFGAGSIVGVSGFGGIYLPNNGIYTILGPYSGYSDAGFSVGSITGVTSLSVMEYYVLGYPAMIPTASIANDSNGGISPFSRALAIDFFGFVWNKGLIGSATIDPTQSRY